MCDNGASSEDVLSSSQKSNMVKGKSEAKVKASGGKLLPTPAKSSQIMPKGKGSFGTYSALLDLEYLQIDLSTGL